MLSILPFRTLSFRLLAAGLLSAALAGCGCGTVDCDACDPFADELVLFRLDADTLQNGFRKAEVASAYVVRYANPDFTQPRDTIRQQFQGLYQGFGFTNRDIALNLLFAGKISTAAQFLGSSYRVVVPLASRQFDISNLEISTEDGTGCCPCSYNTRRRYFLNSRPITADGTSYSGTVLSR
ncbi:hypothetical protein [Hymenobacter sp. BT190]|uniref:hypothetical protein n=1 Tax=Hymenobacter sp. BT190 TaxID=2763505 RepID=UPI001650E54E|nr:hypothetical protein [Hymenobacter sp. BT190]MBC6697588.1 hypothetical protein [Hymenobacter sp. BT190]